MATLAALLRERAKELTRHLSGAIRGELRGVHQGRVASRRLRESLPAAGVAGASALRARKTFRQVTRALGPVRELDVALGHLEDALESDEPEWGKGAAARKTVHIPRIAIDRVRAHVEAERERRRARMLARLEQVDVAGAVGRVERIATASQAEISAGTAQALARRVRARALGLELSIERAGTLYQPERLHAVRIAGKKLRYVLEVVGAATLAGVARDLRILKQAQALLGLMHDYQVLLEHVAAVADATPRGTPGSAGLRAMAAAYDRKCRKLHAGYLKLAPGMAASAHRLRKLDLKVRNTKR